jgi:NADPH2:quinone reductase
LKAAFIIATGPPEKICYAELPEPSPGDRDVLVEVKTVTVDPVDTYIRSGKYKIPLPTPFVIGRDMTGVVRAIGSAVKNFKVGDRVWANNQGYEGRQGTFAEILSVREDLLYHLPEGAKDETSVAVLHSATTAVVGLILKANIRPGDKIFLNGGSGNIGTVAIQIAKRYGAQVAVTAGHKEKQQWCRKLGADLVIDYQRDSVIDALKKFAPDGFDVYWDLTNAPDLEQAVECCAHRGHILMTSGLGYHSAFPVGQFYRKNITAHGFTITDLSTQQLRQIADKINFYLASGLLKSRIVDIWPLSRAAEAHTTLEAGDVFGKIVLTP